MFETYCYITDRFGNELRKPIRNSTQGQAELSFALMDELLDIGYCHDYQNERYDIVEYINRISYLIDKARKIKEVG